MLLAVAPKIKSPKSSIERQASLDRQTSVESVDSSLRTTSPTVMSTSRRSSTDTILASPKIIGSEDFSIDLSTDSLKVEIGERKRPESSSAANVSERQILLEKMFESQSSIDQLSERSMESPRPTSVASSAATVVESPKKKTFGQLPFEQTQAAPTKDISASVKKMSQSSQFNNFVCGSKCYVVDDNLFMLLHRRPTIDSSLQWGPSRIFFPET